MSEPLLKAILRLFAIVAHEDEITKQERDQIRLFLQEHLSRAAVEGYMTWFDEHSQKLSRKGGDLKTDVDRVNQLCQEANAELTQKQKVVIILELISIIEADGTTSPREETLLNTIADNFKITAAEVRAIRTFVAGKQASQVDHEKILVIDAAAGSLAHSRHIIRPHLSGFIAVLYIQQSELYFVKYLGGSDVYLNGVPVKAGRIGVLAVGSTLRWDKDDPIYYGDILNQFKTFGQHTALSFEGRDLTFAFRNGRLGLRGVNLSEEAGNLVALMGASGAGKSTLLHVLNGSEKALEGSGAY